jgi:hypothetical protein
LHAPDSSDPGTMMGRVGIARRWGSIRSKRGRRNGEPPARLASLAPAAALHEGAGLRDLRPHRVGNAMRGAQRAAALTSLGPGKG